MLKNYNEIIHGNKWWCLFTLMLDSLVQNTCGCMREIKTSKYNIAKISPRFGYLWHTSFNAKTHQNQLEVKLEKSPGINILRFDKVDHYGFERNTTNKTDVLKIPENIYQYLLLYIHSHL